MAGRWLTELGLEVNVIRSLFYSPPRKQKLEPALRAVTPGPSALLLSNTSCYRFFFPNISSTAEAVCVRPPKTLSVPLLFLTRFRVNPADPHLTRGWEEAGACGGCTCWPAEAGGER